MFLTGKLKRTWVRYSWLIHAITLTGAYAFWVWIVRLLTLSLITYFTISPNTHFQDINDAFSSNEVSLMGFSATLFVFLYYQFRLMSSFQLNELINQEKIDKSFVPEFAKGALIIGGLVLLFILFGAYRYLGYYIQFDEAPLEIANVLLRMITLVGFAYCETFIFYDRIQKKLLGHIPNLLAANLIAMTYCGIKLLQFDIGWMQSLTLYLLSLSLYFRSHYYKNFARSAGFLAAVLVISHPILSLPIFGNLFSGMFIVKYQTQAWVRELVWGDPYFIQRLLTGGVGGPFSSLAFQLVLLLDFIHNLFRARKVN
jgi:hypothetical protein